MICTCRTAVTWTAFPRRFSARCASRHTLIGIHLAEYLDKEGKLDTIIDHHIERDEPYEEELMYWRKANAIHKFFVDNAAHGVDDCQPVQVTLDVLKDLIDR